SPAMGTAAAKQNGATQLSRGPSPGIVSKRRTVVLKTLAVSVVLVVLSMACVALCVDGIGILLPVTFYLSLAIWAVIVYVKSQAQTKRHAVAVEAFVAAQAKAAAAQQALNEALAGAPAPGAIPESPGKS